ncbi:hypothetical protein P7K49_025123, partial [Saguinus oedipus]
MEPSDGVSDSHRIYSGYRGLSSLDSPELDGLDQWKHTNLDVGPETMDTLMRLSSQAPPRFSRGKRSSALGPWGTVLAEIRGMSNRDFYHSD